MLKWPLRLRAVPRFWGAVVTDHAKNPVEWRGRRFPMGDLLGQSSAAAIIVTGDEGKPLKVDGRGVWLLFPGTREGGLMSRVRRRWLERRLSDGTLDVLRDGGTDGRDLRWLTIVFSVVLPALVVGMAWNLMAPNGSLQVAQWTLVDWVVFGVGMLGMFGPVGVVVGGFAAGMRGTCWRYRLTARTVTPLVGPLAGRELRLAEAVDFDEEGVAPWLVFPEGRLKLFRPPLPLSVLLGRQEEQRSRRRRTYRRVLGYAIVGVVVVVVVMILIQPITGVPAWRSALGLLAIPPMLLVQAYGEGGLRRVFASLERRGRQRKNRHEAAAGRRFG